MTAPTLWIFIPSLLAVLLLFLPNDRLRVLIASCFAFFLTLSACLIPIDTSLTVGSFSFKVTSTFSVLGRSLVLGNGDRAMLALVYGAAVIWFIASLAARASRYFIPLGLIIITMLVAAVSVEPFLYAALLIELAVLLSVPLLATKGQAPGKGILRFLIFQTLAMPFFLFSGWLLAGIDANPGNLGLVQQVVILITLGFALLLAVFPFYSWIPLLAEEASPFIVGFIYWVFPSASLFFGLGFLDRYTWLRDAPSLASVLTFIGSLMIVTAGLLATFQKHPGRILGYAAIMETGYSLVAISQGGQKGLYLFYLLIIPRVLSFVVWAFSLSVLKMQYPHLTLETMKGCARTWPFSSAGLLLAALALTGVPLLAGFPAHQSVWEGLAARSLTQAAWVLIGSLGLLVGVLRIVYSMVNLQEETAWGSRETPFQRALLVIGVLAIFILGIFPQWALVLWTKLPAMFLHLGQ